MPIPELSKKAQTTAIFPALTNSSLISIGQLYDDECTVVMNKANIKIIKDNKIILQGSRNKLDGLYDIPIKRQKYYHACLSSPTTRTLQAAVKQRNFFGWPGINNIKFEKDLPDTMATAMGHLDQ